MEGDWSPAGIHHHASDHGTGSTITGEVSSTSAAAKIYFD